MSYFAVAAKILCDTFFFIWKSREKTSNCLKKTPIQFIYGMQHSALLILRAEIQFSDIIFFFCHFSTSVHFPSSPYPNVFLSFIFWVFLSLRIAVFYAFMFSILYVYYKCNRTYWNIMMNELTLFKRCTIKCNFLLQWCNFCISIEFCTILFHFH